MAQTLQVSKDPSLGHLALEAAQGRFNPFVFTDGHLGHKNRLRFRSFERSILPITLALFPIAANRQALVVHIEEA